MYLCPEARLRWQCLQCCFSLGTTLKHSCGMMAERKRSSICSTLSNVGINNTVSSQIAEKKPIFTKKAPAVVWGVFAETYCTFSYIPYEKLSQVRPSSSLNKDHSRFEEEIVNCFSSNNGHIAKLLMKRKHYESQAGAQNGYVLLLS